MNYIFLDIDGVLNSKNYILRVRENNKIPRIEYHFDQKAFKVLGEICKRNNSGVVLTSSWRGRFNDNLTPKDRDVYSNRLLEYFNNYSIKLVGLTTLVYADRGKQIKEYIDNNLNTDDKYVVIDDEILDIIPYIDIKNIVKTNFNNGLLKKHVRCCDKIFNNKR